MKKKVIKISMRDVHAVMDHVSKNFATIPAGARLMGSQRPLSEGERLALSYMGGAYMVAGGHGIDTQHLLILYDDSKVS